MGTCTWLVSDEAEEHFSLGKVYLDEELEKSLRLCKDSEEIANVLYKAMVKFDSHIETLNMNNVNELITWMKRCHDWRFTSEAHEDFEDVYLAEDDEDAEEYLEEFGGNEETVYKNAGNLWS